MSAKPLLLILTPSLRISGGNKEIVRLVQEMMANEQLDVVIASMWRHGSEVDTGGLRVVHLLEAEPVASRALVQLPAITLAFRRLLSQLRSGPERRVSLMLTHYSTYFLGWVAARTPRICFNQDMEWLFVPPGVRRSFLKRAILATNRRSAVVTTNAYVTQTYLSKGVQPLGEASIWADPKWVSSTLPQARDIDVLMLVRGSMIKRLDLYFEALSLFRTRTQLRVAVITPDAAVASRVRADVPDIYVLPTDEELQSLYRRSKVFLLLSDVEGFGLPPLEAMGSGCVPACRDSGGVRCYMQGEFAELLFDLGTPVQQIVDTVADRVQSERLPSAEAAQRAFAAGLAAGRVSRANCIRSLQKWIS